MMLHDLVLWLLLTLTVLIALVGAAVVAFSWQLNRANRVVPSVETLAPILWLWAPTQPARMHRRLRSAIAPIHANVAKPEKRRSSRRQTDLESGGDSTVSELSRTLVNQAVALDQSLVAASRLARPQRRGQLKSLNPHVLEVERLSARIVRHEQLLATQAFIGEAQPKTPPVALADLSDQLDLLEEAHSELRAIEAANGLLDPDAIMAQATRERLAVPRSSPTAATGRSITPGS